MGHLRCRGESQSDWDLLIALTDALDAQLALNTLGLVTGAHYSKVVEEPLGIRFTSRF